MLKTLKLVWVGVQGLEDPVPMMYDPLDNTLSSVAQDDQGAMLRMTGEFFWQRYWQIHRN